MNSKEVRELIIGFEDGTYPVSRWSHQSHIYMAIWYLRRFPLSEASSRIKEGIKAYNISKGGKNTATSGYHETITEFYIRVLVQFLREHADLSEADLWEKITMESFMESDFPFRYYSKAYLMSTAARRAWYEPDLKSMSWAFE